MKRVRVFCGSKAGIRAEYGIAAQGLATVFVRRGLGLVYGGGNVGLMGVIADTDADSLVQRLVSFSPMQAGKRAAKTDLM